MSRRVLIIVENLPVPFDRRVWQEATTLQRAGYEVNVICPVGPGAMKREEIIDGVHIYRHPLPLEAANKGGFLLEYAGALFWQVTLALRVAFTRGFDVIHACNPPDLIFLVAWLFVPFGKKFLFDHHDICPEIYETKFGGRGLFYKLLLLCERLTFMTCKVSIATNESYRKIAIERGRMPPERVFVVRSGPDMKRLRRVDPVPAHRQGRTYLVGYVGVMGEAEGLDYLVEAVHHLVHVQGRTDIQFALVGDGTHANNIKALARERRVDDFMTFVGRVPDEELLSIICTADICVNPDVWTVFNDQSTMNKVVEYMALGKALVQFDLAEGRVSAQEASLYAKRNDAVDLAEKMVELLADPERRRRMGEFGRQRVENVLEWRHEAPRLLWAYDCLFEGRP